MTPPRRQSPRPRPTTSSALDRLNLHAAGIDIGAESHWIAVPEDSSETPVREFRAFTGDLLTLADWLTACGITTVAMESTGVYWIPLFEILEERGFEVILVDARHVRNVTGRKTDVLDCQWIQTLHTYGLLRGAFRPADDICVLRAYLRQRDLLVTLGATHIQHMQKALTLMNLKLQHVLSDITGVTGLRIVTAILAGEHDPATLAALRDYRCQRTEADIAAALTGHYRPEHLFALRQAYALYQECQRLLAECDAAIDALLQTFDIDPRAKDVSLPPPSKRTRPPKNGAAFDARARVYQLTGVDVAAIGGLNGTSALALLSGTGTDMTRWASDKHFASWMGICPGNKKSGGKILSGRTKPCANRAAAIFRMAAYSVHHSTCALGAYYRRMRARLGAPKAITATAHKIARLYYAMLRTKTDYVSIGQAAYDQRYQERRVTTLARQARELGYTLVPQPAAA